MTPKFQAEIAKAFGSFKLPQVDLQALSQLQSKNIDAVLKATQLLADAGQAVVRRQLEVASQGIEDAVKASQQVFEAKTPEAKFASQIDATKAAYGRTAKAVKELAELVAKPGQKAVDILQARFLAQTAELEALVAKTA